MPTRHVYPPQHLALAVALVLGCADVSMAQPVADIASPAQTTAELQGRLKAFADAPDTHPAKNPKPHKDAEQLADTNDLATLGGRAKFVGALDGGGGINVLQLDAAKGGTLEEARHFVALHTTKGEWEHAGRFAGWAVIEPKTTLVNTGHIDGQVGVLGTFDNKGVVANHVNLEKAARMTNTGTVTGRVDVAEKAWFSGNGTVELLNVAGELEIGPKIGAPSVTRDLALSETANLIYRIDADGRFATLDVGGTARLDKATLTVTGVAGEDIEAGEHTVIRASAIEGEFGQVVSELAFVDANAHYPDKQEVRLTYTRNKVPIEAIATSEHGQAIAASIDAPQPVPVETPAVAQAPAVEPTLDGAAHTPSAAPNVPDAAPVPARPLQAADPVPRPNAAISALLGTNRITAADALDQLSGYHTSDLGNATLSSIAPISTSMLSAMGQDTPGHGYGDGQVWVRAIGHRGTVGKQLGGDALKHSTEGLVLGTDWAVSPTWRLGIIGGKSQTRLDGYRFDGGLDSWQLGAYALRQGGPLALRVGATFGDHVGSTKRHVAFNGFSDRLKGRYDARTQQVFTQLGYELGSGPVEAEPYIHLGYQRYQRDGFTEKGGDAALQFNRQAQDAYHSNLGLRLARTFALDHGKGLTPRLNIGWRHRYGEVKGVSEQRLAKGGATYTVEGIELDRDSLLLEAGLDLALSPRHTLGLGYSGETGQDNRHGALTGQWRMMF
ncbi:autotransporter domain-containing protein [Pseudomonas citrulli]|uniref:Autotransporter domain-containing protein n=1 Tax=Pseudomonas citrulli TaxID=3064347 RepID=A0ABT9C121_9PSED|nr:autotransporter domain-containing protein [Pseudomonas sp. K18]MDO7898500.1 autotransporter domain-containing protein [Pseudomonas sp. K18]